ncbi:MAG: Ig-like domain-containing protein [Candidatus Latescibacteria bacterium]|nr:Ig-like domain-containing protein [Candidatus Latescibacterota bacterium]
MTRPLLFVLLLAAGIAQAQNLADSGQALPGVWAGQAAWGDYDGDGDPDLALIGETAENGQVSRIARIFRYDQVGLVEDEAQRERLSGVYFGEVAWADYDGDGDLDLSLVGWDQGGEESLRLYHNEAGASSEERLLSLDLGQGALEGVRYASQAWGDYDGDGDLDLAVAGLEHNGTSLTQLYHNQDGVLAVDEANSGAVVNMHNGALAWADYDGDGDLDLSAAGENVTTTGGLGPVSEFYKNDPTGTLNLDPSLVVDNKLKGGGLAWADYDGDGNLDLAISGRDGSWNAALGIYRNRPTGVLTLDESFTLNTSRRLSARLAWVDYDNDGDPDLAASGTSILSDYKTLVFPNRSGALSGAPAEEFPGLAGGAVAWADHDSDGRVDLLVSGADAAGTPRTILYSNLGTPVANTLPEPPSRLNPVQVSSGQALFSWAPGSDAESNTLTYDLRFGTEPGSGDIFSGAVAVGPGSAGAKTSFALQRFLPPDTYYWSVRAVDGALARSAWSQESQVVVQQFVSSDQRLRALKEAAMSWGDFDQDGDQDLVIMGQNRSGEAQSLLYENATGTLQLRQDVELSGLRNGDAAWGDYDSDGDLDLLITGEDIFENRNSLLYRAVPGADGYTLELAGSFPKLSKSEADWGDYDNDGDLDLALMGQSDQITGGLQQSFTQVFRNEGEGGFADAGFDLIGLNNGELAWADVDGDGDLDLALNGSSSEGTRQFRLYRNEGALVDAGLELPGLESSDLAWGDFDRDGDPDLAAGGIGDAGPSTALYENQGGQLSARADILLPGIQGGDLVWGDYDNDQDLDLAIAGNNGQAPFLRVYENTIGRAAADSAFAAAQLPLLQGVDFSAVALADIEGDGDLDLVSTGRDASFAPSAAVNDNLAAQQFNPNRAPAVPSGVAALDSASTVVLSWSAAADDGDPPAPSLRYNLRVGTAPGQGDVLSGSGSLAAANAGQGLAHRLQGLASGTYYWSVQTVDAGFSSSAWSSPQEFVIDTVPPQVSGLRLGRRQAGIGQTISLVLSFADEHAGVDAGQVPQVSALLGGQEFAFQTVQFTGDTWSGELTISAQMPSGEGGIAVRGLRDRKQNELVPFDSAGAFAIDTEVPRLVASIPADGATAVSIASGEVVLSFSEPMDEGVLTADHFEVEVDNSHLDLIAPPAYDAQARAVHLLLGEGLAPGSQYRLEVSAALQDSAGNRLANALTLSFSTQVPQLQSTVPAAGDTAVAGSGQIAALFDIPLNAELLADPEMVHVLREGEEVELEPARFDPARNELTAAIQGGLRPGSRYEVVLSRALAGALQGEDFRWSFRTPVPQLEGTQPAEGDTAVAAGLRELSASFSDPLDAAQVEEENVEVFRGGEAVGVADLLYGEEELRIVLEEPLQAGTSYQVRLAAALGGPLRTTDYLWSFRTPVPQLEGTQPADGNTAVAAGLRELSASFSDPLNAGLLGEEKVGVFRGGEAVGVADLLYGEEELRIVLEEPLQAGTSYQVRLAAALGGPLRAADYLWNFSTAVPRLVGVSPAAGAAGVEAGALEEAVVSFDMPLDSAQVKVANFTLQQEGKPVALRPGDPVARGQGQYGLAPAEGWQVGSTYGVAVAAGALGPLGASQGVSWSFQTLAPDTVEVSPAAGSTAAPGDGVVAVSFDSGIETGQLEGAVEVLREGEEAALREAPRFDAGTRTLSFELAEGFRPGSRYEVVVSRSVAGPLRTEDFRWTFRTPVPQLVQALPAAGDTSVTPGTAELQAQFTEALDEVALKLENAEVRAKGEQVPLSELRYEGQELRLVLAQPLQAGTSYQVRLAAALGGPLRQDQGDYAWNFSTRIPAIERTLPPAGGTIPAGRRRLQVVFSSPLDTAQITPQNFRLSKGGEEISLERNEFQYDPATRTLSFPFVDFVAGSAYQALISSRVRGPLGADQPDVQWPFSTEVPTVVSTLPAAGAEGVSTALPTLQVAFSGPVASLGADFFQLRARSLDTPDAAPEVVPLISPTKDASGTLISFAPRSGLRPFTEYEVVVDRQVLGELVEADYTWKFSTAARLASPAQGGLVSNASQDIELYFPPNALQGGSGEITIRPWEATAAKPAVQEAGLSQIGLAYELDAGGAILRKPATLNWRYSATQLGSHSAARLGLFRLEGSQWQRVGGMADLAGRQVRTAVEQLGIYALFEDLRTQVGSLAIESLDCQPRAFAPAGGDLRNQTDISFGLSGPADVTVRIYNASGRLEKVLLRDAPMAPGSISLSWDGKDEDHRVVASGLYIVVVNAGSVRREQVVAVVR